MLNDTELETHLLEQELQLASATVRGSTPAVAALLSDDFVEFGGSGRQFSKQEILALLDGEPAGDSYEVKDASFRRLGPESALVTYKIPARTLEGTIKTGSLRSSIWVEEDGDVWRIVFHQGTRF